jgi:hypothetical protein
MQYGSRHFEFYKEGTKELPKNTTNEATIASHIITH